MNSPAARRRLVVLGAGPVGLAAALGACLRGLDVTVLERDEVGASLLRWGPTKFFSTLEMNLPPGAREVLGDRLPPPNAILTGPEFVERVLVPLASSPPLAGRVRSRHRVIAIGRAGMVRGDYAGHPLRGERTFRLLVEVNGGEILLEADQVLDATGTYGQPTFLGRGGVPAQGERALGAKMIRHLGELDARRATLEQQRILLVGDGHSAANAILLLEAVAGRAPETRVIWAIRTPNLRPCVEVASDPLPERSRVVSAANALAARPPPWLRIERRASVERLAEEGSEVRVSLTGDRSCLVNHVVALTGYRPDLSFLSELGVDVAPSTEGAGGLARALAGVTDCLSVPEVSPEDLASGEPGFHLVGAKSYGRSSTFLLKTGYAQLETILDRLI